MAAKRKTHSYRISAPHKQTRWETHLLVQYFLKCCLIWIYPPPRIPVTTRFIIFLVENPNLNLYLPLASWVVDRSNVFIHPFIFPGQLQVLANLLLLPGVSFDEGIAQHFRYILIDVFGKASGEVGSLVLRKWLCFFFFLAKGLEHCSYIFVGYIP